MSTHGKYGGVVPELASREHLRAIVPVVREALDAAGDPAGRSRRHRRHLRSGLVGSLLVGLTYAKSLCFARGVPLIAVNHIEGHIHAVMLEATARSNFPRWRWSSAAATRTCSKSATDSTIAPGQDPRRCRRRGFRQSGQAARASAIPAARSIDDLASFGDPAAVRFTFAKMKGNTLDFSFSGLKTAVLRWVQAREMDAEIEARRELARESVAHGGPVAGGDTAGDARLLASFQHAVIEELLSRATASAEQIGARSLIVSGGVACNSGLRAAAESANCRIPFIPHSRTLHRQRRDDRRRQHSRSGNGGSSQASTLPRRPI